MARFNIDEIQRGTVYDQNGDKVGGVGQIYLDDATSEPNWVTVNTGLFGTKETFVPLDGATVTGDEIRVPYTKDVIKDAPGVDADGHIDEAQEAELYRYYNLGGGQTVAGDVDRTVDVDRDRTADVDVDRTRGTDGVTLHEEQLRVGKERVETGRARLRKHVVTEQKTVSVPVEREEVQVVREPIADGERGGTLGNEEVEVTLHEERPVVQKDVVATERVGLQTNTVTEERQVSAEVGREEVEVVGDRDVDRSSWTDADYEREGYTRDEQGGWLDRAGNKVKNVLDRDNDGRVGR